MSERSPEQAALDNHANQLNAHHRDFYRSRGESDEAAEVHAALARKAAREAAAQTQTSSDDSD